MMSLISSGSRVRARSMLGPAISIKTEFSDCFQLTKHVSVTKVVMIPGDEGALTYPEEIPEFLNTNTDLFVSRAASTIMG